MITKEISKKGMSQHFYFKDEHKQEDPSAVGCNYIKSLSHEQMVLSLLNMFLVC